ncbi:MAG: hydrogenase [Selenomonas sp.]|jgi:hydrogenase-4 component E|uniref:Hydrogenase n=1 Tax=Selenomonas ruminantium TaxID=971 RepID=A0A927WSL2_SELRU|nr:hydrogenase [Selenomonas ruminantium]MBE6091998.1 hydrogenase [Selenomonas ruminantium]MBO5650099.1 hydrogenase [Selenomonas sp.]
MEYLVVLLLAVVYFQTRVMELKRSVVCLMAQSAIIACACLLAGLNHGLMHALIPFALTLGVKVLFIPMAMLKLIKRITDEREIFSDINVNYSTMAAAAFLVFGYVLGSRFMLDPLARDFFAATIMMIMTGLALMVMRKRAILQMCGLITLENGIYLLGLIITEGLPLVVELGVFLDVLIAVVVLVILTNRMSLSFMTTDTTVMRKLKG